MKFFLLCCLERARVEDALAIFSAGVLIFSYFNSTFFQNFSTLYIDIFFVFLPLFLLLLKVFFMEVVAAIQLRGGEKDPLHRLSGFLSTVGNIVRDWFPFALSIASYYSLYLNFVLRVKPPADATLAAFDKWLLGDQIAFILEPFITPFLSGFLSIAYVSYLLFFPGISLYFYLKDRKAFHDLMVNFLVLFILAIISFILVPAEGPLFFFADSFKRSLDGNLYQKTSYLIEGGRIHHDCFPSLHVGIPLMVTIFFWKLKNGPSIAFFLSSLFVSLQCLATVYLRYHYFADVLAAFIFVPFAMILARFLSTRWTVSKQKLCVFLRAGVY